VGYLEKEKLFEAFLFEAFLKEKQFLRRENHWHSPRPGL
jgi:hypothetical protein